MPIDTDELLDQVRNGRKQRVRNAAPPKVRMEMGGREFMVCVGDVHDFTQLGYRQAPADPNEGTKAGEYREGKYVSPLTLARAAKPSKASAKGGDDTKTDGAAAA